MKHKHKKLKNSNLKQHGGKVFTYVIVALALMSVVFGALSLSEGWMTGFAVGKGAEKMISLSEKEQEVKILAGETKGIKINNKIFYFSIQGTTGTFNLNVKDGAGNVAAKKIITEKSKQAEEKINAGGQEFILKTITLGKNFIVIKLRVPKAGKEKPASEEKTEKDAEKCAPTMEPIGDGAGTIKCYDTDNGINAGVGGVVVMVGSEKALASVDSCKISGGDALLTEYYCEGNTPKLKMMKCAESKAGTMCNKELTACAPECIKSSDCADKDKICVADKCKNIFTDISCVDTDGPVSDFSATGKVTLKSGGITLGETDLKNAGGYYASMVGLYSYPFQDACIDDKTYVDFSCKMANKDDMMWEYLKIKIPATFGSVVYYESKICPGATKCFQGACLDPQKIPVLKQVTLPKTPLIKLS